MGRCVLIGAGEIKDYESAKALVNEDDTVVCADGGYVHAEKMGLEIDCVIGDFDSSEKPDCFSTRILPVEKDVTDTFYCAQEFVNRGYTDFLLLGMSGGRFDHTYANIQTLCYLSNRNCNAVMIDETNKIYILKENEAIIHFTGYPNISFFSLFADVDNLEIKNAKYNLSSYKLKADDPLCVSNSFVDEADIFIKKSSGSLLVVESK